MAGIIQAPLLHFFLAYFFNEFSVSNSQSKNIRLLLTSLPGSYAIDLSSIQVNVLYAEALNALLFVIAFHLDGVDNFAACV